MFESYPSFQNFNLNINTVEYMCVKTIISSQAVNANLPHDSKSRKKCKYGLVIYNIYMDHRTCIFFVILSDG